MTVSTIPVRSFPDRRPGTSGPRKKVSVFRQPGYLETFVQSVFGALPEAVGDDAIVYRLSGTGTEEATTRVYLERFEPDPARHQTAMTPRSRRWLRRPLSERIWRLGLGARGRTSWPDLATHGPFEEKLCFRRLASRNVSPGARLRWSSPAAAAAG